MTKIDIMNMVFGRISGLAWACGSNGVSPQRQGWAVNGIAKTADVARWWGVCVCGGAPKHVRCQTREAD